MDNGTYLKPAISDGPAANINDAPETETAITTTIDENPTIETTVSKVSPQSSKKQAKSHSLSAASVALPGSRKGRHAEPHTDKSVENIARANLSTPGPIYPERQSSSVRRMSRASDGSISTESSLPKPGGFYGIR